MWKWNFHFKLVFGCFSFQMPVLFHKCVSFTVKILSLNEFSCFLFLFLFFSFLFKVPYIWLYNVYVSWTDVKGKVMTSSSLCVWICDQDADKMKVCHAWWNSFVQNDIPFQENVWAQFVVGFVQDDCNFSALAVE